MANLPASVANEALLAAGINAQIGDLTEGSAEARAMLVKYGECMRQLLRAAPWNFCRKQAPLVLLADATSQTPSVGTIVVQPWIYEYALPGDCMRARFVPQNYLTPTTTGLGNISLPSTPLYPNEMPASPGMRLVPARWLEATDFNYPVTPQPSNAYELGTALDITSATQASPITLGIPGNTISNGALVYVSGVTGMTELNGGTYAVENATGTSIQLTDADTIPINSTAWSAYVSGGTVTPIQATPPASQPWGEGTQWWTQQGLGPQQRTVILTNVKGAQLVYNAFVPYPSQWDSLFRAAMVAYLAAEVALPLAKDKKFGLALRQQNIAIAKEKIIMARVADGNEGWHSADITPDWLRVREQGHERRGLNGDWGSGGGLGYFYGGWGDCCGAGNTSAY